MFLEFREELPAAVNQGASPSHTGEEIRLSAEAKAREIIQRELGALGWPAEELERRRKGDAEKVRIAKRLRQETTMTLAWIARSLHTGAAGHVSCLLYRREGDKPDCEDTNPEQTIVDKLF